MVWSLDVVGSSRMAFWGYTFVVCFLPSLIHCAPLLAILPIFIRHHPLFFSFFWGACPAVRPRSRWDWKLDGEKSMPTTLSLPITDI